MPTLPNTLSTTEATLAKRAYIRANRAEWLDEDPASVAAKYRAGELDVLDLDSPAWRNRQLGLRRTSGENHGAVSGHAEASRLHPYQGKSLAAGRDETITLKVSLTDL